MTKKPQIDKFRDKARELKTSQTEAKFNDLLRRVASPNPDSRALNELAEMVGNKEPTERVARKKRT